MLDFCAVHPSSRSNAAHNDKHDGCVGPPIGWLSVPTTRRRPDMLWISIHDQRSIGEELREVLTGSYCVLHP